MSIRLIGDGSLTSSISFTTLTLSVGAAPDRTRDNAEVIEGDAGADVQYERGTYREVFAIHVPMLTSAAKKSLKRDFYHRISGRANWFTLQPHQQPVIADMAQQGSGSTTILQNSLLNQADHTWRGYWALIKTGLAQALWRKIQHSYAASNQVVVYPAFDYTVATGNTFMLGYPVHLATDEIIFIPRHPDWWECQMTLIEKVMG